MKRNMSFDDLISKLRTGNGDGIVVRSDGQIDQDRRPQDSAYSAAPFTPTDAPDGSANQDTPEVHVRKTVWGGQG